MKHFITAIIQWYTAHLSYSVLALLMAAESTIFPLPSELIIPPAAASGKFTVVGIVIAGTLGSWVGASIMYWVSRAAGRPLVMRYGGYVGISAQKIEGAERWADHFGPMGIFISRLLPVVRHLIGIPAGIVRMDYKLFSLFTVLGSGIWCAILCWLGIRIAQENRAGEYRHIVVILSAAVIVLGVVYYTFVHRHMKAAPEKSK